VYCSIFVKRNPRKNVSSVTPVHGHIIGEESEVWEMWTCCDGEEEGRGCGDSDGGASTEQAERVYLGASEGLLRERERQAVEGEPR
jgi:hypothetical protein